MLNSSTPNKFASIAKAAVPIGVLISSVGFMNFDDNFPLKITLQSVGTVIVLAAAIFLIVNAAKVKKESEQ
ncbi:MAG: hypothetical protein NWR72_01080 [Bacteroidia bacterium]|nr:hypothetical protein [Bacteroidia bacterium]